MSYKRFPIETDPDALAQDSFAYLSDLSGGVWQPADGNLDTWLIEATARQAAEVRDVAADVPPAIFRTFGQLASVAPFDPVAAQAIVELTLRDDTGYVLPAGTTFGISDATGATHAFALADDETLPAGSLGAPLTIQLAAYALEPGSAANGITPRPGNAYLLDALAYVASVELVAPTSGGSDGESDDAYMARLADELTTLSPTPILARDFAVLALSVQGVSFAAAINLYDPGPPAATNVARAVTVVLADAAGEPVSGATKLAVDALLQSMREVNFRIHEADPGYVAIDVAYTVGVEAGYDSAAVLDAVDAAVIAYLSPASFATPRAGEIAGLWTPQPAVRYLDVGLVIQATDGVDHVTALTLNGAAADVALPPPASLPRPGAITGTAA